jgi:hypothetical protein
MEPDLDRVQQRARRYWYDDGLAEIAIGVVFVAIGLLFLAESFRIVPPGFSSFGLIAVVFAGWWLAGRAVRAAKDRITHPRTGFVRYRRETGRRSSSALTGLIAGVIAALTAFLFIQAPLSPAWIPALDGLVVGLFILWMGHSVGLARFYLLASLSALIGVATSLSGGGETLGTGIYFGGMGLVLIASGAATLLLYLRNTQLPEGE